MTIEIINNISSKAIYFIKEFINVLQLEYLDGEYFLIFDFLVMLLFIKISIDILHSFKKVRL